VRNILNRLSFIFISGRFCVLLGRLGIESVSGSHPDNPEKSALPVNRLPKSMKENTQYK